MHHDPAEHDAADPAAIAAARDAVDAAEHVVVLTGAGISTESGIPDFRGPRGVWTRDPDAEKYSTIDYYLSDPELRERAWRHRMDNPAWVAEPNPGHLAVVELQRRGKLQLLVTQNTDGLHLIAGSDPDRLVEVHGNMRSARCTVCGWRGTMQQVLDRVRAGEPDPPCERCGGILKSATIFFGESLVEDDVDRAFAAAQSCELLVCVGTTLQVYPVAHMVPLALGAGASLVIVNAQETPFDDEAIVVRGAIGEVLPQVLGAREPREQPRLSDS